MTNNYNNTELLVSLKRGDPKAYSIFIDQNKNLVFSLALRMLKNREEAEEVAQDSFVKAFKSISTFKGDSKLSTWVYKIVYYGCLDRLKKNKKLNSNISISEKFDIGDQEALSALDKMQQVELQVTVKNCIEKLSSEDGFILTLFYFEELSLEEISEIVDIVPNTLKVKIFRARKKLAEIFKATLEPEIILRYERNK